MASAGWAGSDRRDRLPADWQEIRAQVLARDGWMCQLRFVARCTGTATDADHIMAGDDHRLENLQAACRPCHAHKSALEGAAARPRERRAAERHPGLL